MSCEIMINKRMSGSCACVNEAGETEDEDAENLDNENPIEELNTAIHEMIFKKHIAPKDRRVQKLNSDLLNAIQGDDAEKFARCLQEGANPNAICIETGLSACHVAVLCNKCHLLEKLLKEGANDSFSSWHDGYLPIHLAAWKECLNCLKILVNSTPSNTSASSSNQYEFSTIAQSVLDSWHHDHKLLRSEMPAAYDRCTPLHIACKKVNFRCAEYLLEARANTEAVDGRGMSPLDVVYEAVTAADADAGERPGVCDRDAACRRSAADAKSRSRASSAASVRGDCGGGGGGPPAPRRRPSRDSADGDLRTRSDDASKIISSLVDRDGGVAAAKCASFLFPATFTQNVALLQMLLHKNVDASARDENGDTVLHFAARHRLKRSLLVLLKSDKIKCMLEWRDDVRRTPLLIAISSAWIDGSSALLEYGACVTAVTNEGDTVLHCAAKTTNACIIDGLFTYPQTEKIKNNKNNNEETAIMLAVIYNNVSAATKLIKFGVCLRLASKNNHSLVHVAAANGFSRILKLILREDVDLKEAKSDNNETALHLAAKGGHLECVRHLLSVGCCDAAVTTTTSASFDQDFDFGGTALHYAAWKGHLAVIQALLDYNANLVNVANLNKWFPLHVALYFNHVECADYLVKHGADLSYRVPYADGLLRSSFDILSYTFTDPIAFLEHLFDAYIDKNDSLLTHLDSCITLDFNALAPKGGNRKQMKVLNALLNNEDELLQRQVLLHPLIETFLYLKWNMLRTIFNFNTILYALFTVNLTAFALYVDEPNSTTINVMLFTMFSLLFPLAALEILHAKKLQRYYVKDLESWLKWFTYITTFLIGSHTAYLSIRGFDRFFWNDAVAVPVLLAWIETLFLLSRYPTWGFYILMFFRVAFDVVKVFCTFSSLILGFMFSFYIFFKHEDNSPFYSLHEAFVRIIAMISEFEYSDTFHKSDSLIRDLIARFLFVLFVVLVAIVLMNLMVGLAVSDIATLQAQGRSQTLAKQIDFLYVLERLVYNETLLNLLPVNVKSWIIEHRNVANQYCIYPNRPFDKKTTELPAKLKRLILSKMSARKEMKFGLPRNRADMARRLQLFSLELDSINKELMGTGMENASILSARFE